MLGRPYTMPGGSWHYPIWAPYKLYGEVDHVYGFPAWDHKDGFGGAQGLMNAVETSMYLVYLYYVYMHGHEPTATKGRGAPRKAAQSDHGLLRKLANARVVNGHEGALAVLLLFATATMTLSKTVLYCKSCLAESGASLADFFQGLNEYYSGFAHLGHNDAWTLFFLWVIPK